MLGSQTLFLMRRRGFEEDLRLLQRARPLISFAPQKEADGQHAAGLPSLRRVVAPLLAGYCQTASAGGFRHLQSAELQRDVIERGQGGEDQFRPSIWRSIQQEHRLLRRLEGATLLEVHPETGRTHQIRVHLAHAGHPILGDEKYATKAQRQAAAERGVARLCLHAAGIAVPDWREGHIGEMRSFEAPMPPAFDEVLSRYEA